MHQCQFLMKKNMYSWKLTIFWACYIDIWVLHIDISFSSSLMMLLKYIFWCPRLFMMFVVYISNQYTSVLKIRLIHWLLWSHWLAGVNSARSKSIYVQIILLEHCKFPTFHFANYLLWVLIIKIVKLLHYTSNTLDWGLVL